MLDARSFMISTLRSQVGFAAAVAHARLRLSRLELIGGSGRTAGRYASAARRTRLHLGLGLFSIQEKGNFNTRYQNIMSRIMSTPVSCCDTHDIWT